jgi:hypothetical protein
MTRTGVLIALCLADQVWQQSRLDRADASSGIQFLR